MNLGEVLHQGSSKFGNKAALYFEDTAISFAELEGATTALAWWLLGQGLRKGDRVAVHRSNSIDTAKLFFACWKAGLIVVPLNCRLKADEVAYALQHSGSSLCFAEPGTATTHVREAAVCPVYDTVPSPSELAATASSVDDDDPCVLFYTSGTTARAKGVIHSHGSILAATRMVAGTFLEAGDVVLVPTQMAHVSGMHATMLPALLSGCSAVLLKAFTASAALDAIEKHRGTALITLPLFYHQMLEEQAARPRNVSSVRVAVSGGDTTPEELQNRCRRHFQIPIFEGLFMTETLPIALNRKNVARAGSLGTPPDGVSIRIVDENDAEVTTGQTGEIVVRSPANCIGYWNDAGATAELMRNGWLHTGDLGRRDSDGYFWFEGRKKQIIIRGGSNISPQQVEGVLLAHPSVSEAGVVGVLDPVFGERVIAFVRLSSGPLNEQEMREFASRRLSDYKVPERIIFLPEMPKGITGKVDRRGLKEMLIANPGLLSN